jgi:ABC-type transport system involved in cytochrome bd biosynthesis fused ATPase/permease subunit
LALAALLGALTILFGVGLMAAAGYLISRAAEQPAVLSLTVAIVASGSSAWRGRSPAISSASRHTTSRSGASALRAPASTGASRTCRRHSCEEHRHGDLLASFVGDVDSLQNLYLRGLLPPVVALVAGAGAVGLVAAILPSAALVLAAGLVAAGIVVPFTAAALARRSAALPGSGARSPVGRAGRDARRRGPSWLRTAGWKTAWSGSALPTAG